MDATDYVSLKNDIEAKFDKVQEKVEEARADALVKLEQIKNDQVMSTLDKVVRKLAEIEARLPEPEGDDDS